MARVPDGRDTFAGDTRITRYYKAISRDTSGRAAIPPRGFLRSTNAVAAVQRKDVGPGLSAMPSSDHQSRRRRLSGNIRPGLDREVAQPKPAPRGQDAPLPKRACRVRNQRNQMAAPLTSSAPDHFCAGIEWTSTVAITSDPSDASTTIL